MTTGDTAPDRLPAYAEVRRAGPEQWAVYRQLRLMALADAPYAFSSSLERERAFGAELWRDRLASAAASFLAWRGEDPVGMATGKIDDPDDEYTIPGAWQLVAMWVAPAARGLAVADSLVDAVTGHVRTTGAPSLVLWVTEVNDRARAFYKRAGFAVTGARQLVRPDEPDHWEVQMIRQLS